MTLSSIISLFFFFTVKLSHRNSDQADQVSVVSLSDIRISCCCIRNLFLQRHRLSVFGIRAVELCSPAAELHDETFPAEQQESAVYSTVLYDHEKHFPEIKRIQKLKQGRDKNTLNSCIHSKDGKIHCIGAPA